MKTVLLMLNGATLDGQPHLLEFLIGNLKWLTTNNPFQCISFDHVLAEKMHISSQTVNYRPHIASHLLPGFQNGTSSLPGN